MKRTLALSLVALFSLVSIASAQPDDKKPAPAPPAKVKVLTIEGGEDISGDVPTGELIPVGVREMAKSTSLIRIRHDFIDLILKSAEDLH